MALAKGPLSLSNCRSPRPQSKYLPNQRPRSLGVIEPMEPTLLNPNHRILIVDDNPAIHKDFRKILCPERPGESEVPDLKAALFDKAPKARVATDFELVSAMQGQEALEVVEKALAEGRSFAMAFLD